MNSRALLINNLNAATRPDLSNRSIHLLLTGLTIVIVVSLIAIDAPNPGTLYGQSLATIGALFLLVPFVFSILKRSDSSINPPHWFIAHVICAFIGSIFIFIHALAGNWISPPGLVLLLMLSLIFQGSWVRSHLTKSYSFLFARNSMQSGFRKPKAVEKIQIQSIIDRKIALLESLDSDSDEALFSPALRHWTKHPVKSFRYQLLADAEAKLIGARQQAGFLQHFSRRIHMAIAIAFLTGLLAHVITVLFFAGYVAGDEPITWWYVTDWGR